MKTEWKADHLAQPYRFEKVLIHLRNEFEQTRTMSGDARVDLLIRFPRKAEALSVTVIEWK